MRDDISLKENSKTATQWTCGLSAIWQLFFDVFFAIPFLFLAFCDIFSQKHSFFCFLLMFVFVLFCFVLFIFFLDSAKTFFFVVLIFDFIVDYSYYTWNSRQRYVLSLCVYWRSALGFGFVFLFCFFVFFFLC